MVELPAACEHSNAPQLVLCLRHCLFNRCLLRYVLLVRVQVLLSTYTYIQYGIRSSTYSTEYVLVHTSTVCTEMVCVGERGTVCECDFDDA